MQVRVVMFGSLKDILGAELQLEVAEGVSAGAVWALLREKHAALARFDRAVALAVNQEYAEPTRVLRAGDELALLPPVSGGLPETRVEQLPLETLHARLQRDPIDAASLAESIKHGEDGAVCVFDGVVRNNTRGRKTLYLDYDCYPAMAVSEMEKLAVEALSRFAVRDVRLVHRVGRMEIGESSVLIVVASAHRAAAFDACRWLIDTLKKKVPVWKKEFFEDGAVWADGEPFPPEVKTI